VLALQKDLDSMEANRVEAVDALAESERAISDTNRRLYQLSRERTKLTADLTMLGQQAAALSTTVANEQARLAQMLVQQYTGGESDSFRLFLSGQNPAEVSRQLAYYRYIGQARAALVADLRADKARVATLTADVETQRAKLDELTRDEAAQKTALNAERKARAVVATRIAHDVSLRRRELSTAKRDEERLARLIERLGKIRERSPAAPSRPIQDEVLPDSAFARMRGKLELPVHGELANRFGGPRADGGTHWKGWFIRCPPGQSVRSVAAGQVVYAEWLRGFGNLLIVDHGDGYMSLYANNDALLSTVGALVNAGEVVAQAGASGGSPETGVYFEMRFQGKAIDPTPWIAR
jgi:septal ring factor EnvC (AmiA/AmiB activator)